MSKLPHIGTTIFTVMSQLANAHKAINLSQGFPNFPVDSRLTDILKSISSDSIHQYAPMGGTTSLLEGIAGLTYDRYGRSLHPSKEILVTAGATEGIFATIQALVMPGEEVIILDPSYDCYEPPITLMGANAIRVPLHDDFSPNWEAIEEVISSNTSLFIFNNPHNPSGTLWKKEDIDRLEKLADKHPKLTFLSDEVYEFITFEEKHISINSRPNLSERTIIVSSFGKTFHITGWKIGYVVAPERWLTEVKKVHQFLVFSVNSVAQEALSRYLPLVQVGQLGKFYQEKRDTFRSLLQGSRFELLPSQGTYFQLANYANISAENDVDFCQRLVIEHGVAAIPVSVFHADHRQQQLIRFCFAKDEHTLTQAAERLCTI
jgi:methionine aminotransferase